MKKLLLLFLIIFLYIILSKTIFIKKEEKINIKLKNEIAILLVDSNVLIKNKYNDNLLMLDNNYNISNIKIRDLGIVLFKNMPINIKYSNRYLISRNKTISGIDYSVNNNLIYIKYKTTTFCIFNNIGSTTNDTRECSFLYLYNINNIDNLNIDENIEIVFINNKISLPIPLLEDIYSKDIDVYTLNKNEITVIKVQSNDYNMFVIPNK